MNDLPNLDLLRSVAVLFVVADHVLTQFDFPKTESFAWLGLAGVFIFFVHTSLVLMWSLERKPDPLNFYVRRVFRIYPAAITVILLTVLFHLRAVNYGVAHGGFQYTHPTIRQVIQNLLLVQNWVGGGLIVGVTWSLPLEVQMYVLLPFLFYFVVQTRQAWPLLLLWAFCCLSFLGTFGKTVPMGLLFCIPCFIPGVLAYVGFGQYRPRLPSWSFLPCLAIASMVYVLSASRYPSRLMIAWPFCLAIGLGLPAFHQITGVFLKRTAQVIAKYSYSIYLTHTFVSYFAVVVMQRYHLTLRLAVIPPLVAVLSYALYHCVERPFIVAGTLLARKAERFHDLHRAQA